MIVDIDSGNSQIVTNRFGDKFLFYFDGKKYLPGMQAK